MNRTDYNRETRIVLSVMAVMFFTAVALFLSTIYESVPITARLIGIVDQDGNEKHNFKPGEWLFVKREVCSERGLVPEFSGSLTSTETRAIISQPPARIPVRVGCHMHISGVQVPAGFLPGLYQHALVLTYQANLIGRDQAIVLPPMAFGVSP